MDKEINTKLEKYLSKISHKPKHIKKENKEQQSRTLEKLQTLFRTEAGDIDDDDYYYVLVVDEKDDEEGMVDNRHEKKNPCGEKKVPIKHSEKFDIKIEPDNFVESSIDNMTNEKQSSIKSEPDNFVESSIDYSITDKIPPNVPATILENEEESQDNDVERFNDVISMDENTHNHNKRKYTFKGFVGSQDNSNYGDDIEMIITDDSLQALPNSSSNQLVKFITTTRQDGTLVIQRANGEKITYVADTMNDDEIDEEVILCEGDDDSLQIIKYDSNELIIEYTDDSQIATVLQQDDGTFLCSCGETFESITEYEAHQLTHKNCGEHLCNLCGKRFDSAEILKGHMILHNVTGPLVPCPMCNQQIKRNVLTQHMKFTHSNTKPQCSICNKAFANPNNLKRHMMIHKGIKEFECNICLKQFHQKITMQLHRLTHVKPLACARCDDVFTSTTELQEHKDSSLCNQSKIIRVREELMKTIKQVVTTDAGKLVGYACSVCQKMFSVESALEQHVQISHMVDPLELLCSECGEVLPSKKEMQHHLATHRIVKSKNLKRFECSECGKGCTSQAMLLMHERVHTNERPYACQLCTLKFKTKTHLRTHQLTHTRERKFGCSICMKFFALKGNLLVHLRTHTGERPYVCSLCDEAFIDSKYLKKHKLKKHSIENVPWNHYPYCPL